MDKYRSIWINNVAGQLRGKLSLVRLNLIKTMAALKIAALTETMECFQLVCLKLIRTWQPSLSQLAVKSEVISTHVFQ